MSKRLDLAGQRFGKLVVERPASSDNGYSRWWCKCDCGVRVAMRTTGLRHNNTGSCGCARIENGVKPYIERRQQRVERFRERVRKNGWGELSNNFNRGGKKP